MHKIQTVSFNFEEALTGKQFARVMSIYCEIHMRIQSFEELFEQAISRRAVKLTSHPSLFAATICKLNLISCRRNKSNSLKAQEKPRKTALFNACGSQCYFEN